MVDHAHYELEVRRFFNRLNPGLYEPAYCPFCYKDTQYVHMFFKDLMQIVRCHCGFVYNRNQPSQEALNTFYSESKAMTQWADIKKGQKEKQAEKFRHAAESLADLGVKSVMDIGCGNGVFLSFCKEAGIDDIYGTELSGRAGIIATQIGASVSQVGLDKWAERDDKTYDAISLWGVLEHLKQPLEAIKKIKTRLKPEGHIVICVPNVESTVVRRLWKECSTFCPQHLWYFCRKDIENILYKENFKILEHYCIEPELMPIRKQKLGLKPYENYRGWVQEKFLDTKMTHGDLLLEMGRGYKMITIGKI